MPHVITAEEVFLNRAEVWTFQNRYGDLTMIEVVPADASHSVWHYTKSHSRAYWSPGVKGAELWFNLERDETGAWYSTGGRVVFPEGCPWCSPGSQDFSYQVAPDPGKARPYKIIASGFSSYETTFNDIGVADTFWQTASYMERVSTPFYTGVGLVSEQHEGQCVIEKWTFAPGLGLIKVEPKDAGDCKGLDPNLTMVRIR
ncbi:MAG TPA: hypothetical protein VFL42_00885 [Terriglobales bacterium]|nr:hypothetical protein [Terriglobales bacterium]